MSRIVEPVSMFSFCGFDAAGPGRLSIVQCVQSSSRWWVNREVLVRLLVIEPLFLSMACVYTAKPPNGM